MRTVLILGLVAFLAAAGYGIHRNPRACEKLGLDLVTDTLAIYLTPAPSGTKDCSGSDATLPDTATTGPSRPLSPESLPTAAPQVAVVAPVPPAVPVVAPASVPAVPAAAVAAPAPATAPAQPRPQYSVGYVASIPSAAPPSPTPVRLPSAAPPATQYPSFTDYQSALQAARKYHVPMLVLFTGSDWCQYCQLLEREVLSSDDFAKFSKSHFVFLVLDDLRKTAVADGDKAQIDDLEQKFNITGFPTLVVVDENEQEKGRQEGYDPGSGPEAVIKQLTPFAAPLAPPAAQ